jgi:predicted DsbA family dithiol-disulfide isomerase
VQRDVDDGVAAGVRGTPAFVLGKLRPDNTVESTLLTGARPLADFVREIERVLKER